MVIFFGLIGLGCEQSADNFNQTALELKTETVEIKGKTFALELALTPEERSIGLMGRDYLPDDGGMLFVFPDNDQYPREVSFWMKNCLIPIDVIFIRKDGIITAIHRMEPPQPGTPDDQLTGYSSRGAVQYAIELKGGLAEELGLSVGDQVILKGSDLLLRAE